MVANVVGGDLLFVLVVVVDFSGWIIRILCWLAFVDCECECECDSHASAAGAIKMLMPTAKRGTFIVLEQFRLMPINQNSWVFDPARAEKVASSHAGEPRSFCAIPETVGGKTTICRRRVE